MDGTYLLESGGRAPKAEAVSQANVDFMDESAVPARSKLLLASFGASLLITAVGFLVAVIAGLSGSREMGTAGLIGLVCGLTATSACIRAARTGRPGA
jgi:hypothetical protein